MKVGEIYKDLLGFCKDLLGFVKTYEICRDVLIDQKVYEIDREICPLHELVLRIDS